MAKSDLLRALVVTAEVCGTELSAPAAEAMTRQLAEYPVLAVLGALKRCQREVTGRLSLAAIVQRIDDGHPGVEEAWALCPRSESSTVVWTDEIARAYGVAAPLLAQGDQVAGRLAFKEAYTQDVREARDAKRPPRWYASCGHDARERDAVLLQAVELGRLSADYAETLLVGDGGTHDRLARLVADVAEARRLPA